MSPARWRQIEEVHHAALERDPMRRAGFLAEACHDDQELRREVESLLAQEDAACRAWERMTCSRLARM